MRILRNIVRIDGEKCTGCGDCILACAENAIRIVDGKAQLVSETLCDGFGVCLDRCPENAIAVEEREAEAFDEEAVKERLAGLWTEGAGQPRQERKPQAAESLPAGGNGASPLSHWPIKLNLVPPHAPFLQNADVVLMADCVPFACGDLHRRFVSNNALLIGCPKFENPDFVLARLTEILICANVRSLTVVHMEVPCCAGYWHIARKALADSEQTIPLRQVVIDIHGRLLEQAG